MAQRIVVVLQEKSMKKLDILSKKLKNENIYFIFSFIFGFIMVEIIVSMKF